MWVEARGKYHPPAPPRKPVGAPSLPGRGRGGIVARHWKGRMIFEDVAALKAELKPGRRVLGLDLGAKTVGLASPAKWPGMEFSKGL